MTDKEIITAFEHCYVKKGRCDDCLFYKEDEKCLETIAVLDLIHRLQGENAGLKERGEIVINSLHETIDKQNAKIERLTKLYDETNSELFDRNIELEDFEKSNKSLQTMNFNLSQEKAELQKQVEKLTEENSWLSKECNKTTAECIELQKQVDELKEELGLQKTLYNRARECGYNTGYNSAVKDTAPVAINRFINQLHIDGVLVDDGDLHDKLREVKAFVLKRYYDMEVREWDDQLTH